MNHRIRKPFNARLALILPALALGASTFSAPQAQAKPAAKIVWRTSLPAALKEAKRLHKPLMVGFSASWCPPCREMEEKTYPNAAVIRESQNFVLVKLDPGADLALTKKYKVSIFPTYLFLRSDGIVAYRNQKSEYIPPAQFVKVMRIGRAKTMQSAPTKR